MTKIQALIYDYICKKREIQNTFSVEFTPKQIQDYLAPIELISLGSINQNIKLPNDYYKVIYYDPKKDLYVAVITKEAYFEIYIDRSKALTYIAGIKQHEPRKDHITFRVNEKEKKEIETIKGELGIGVRELMMLGLEKIKKEKDEKNLKPFKNKREKRK
jgi:hypothetical protein